MVAKKYILCACYEGDFDINSHEIVCVGTKKNIREYVKSMRFSTKHSSNEIIKQLFKDTYCEINCEIMFNLLEHHVGYCVMAFCPGGFNELKWMSNEEEALKKYESTVEELKKNTDDEYVYTIKLYQIFGDKFTELCDDIAPYR